MTAVPGRPRITLFTRSYPPAYLAGGPARSLFGLVEALASYFRFSVVTSAHDDPAAGTTEAVEPGRWSEFGQATVWYQHGLRLRARKIATLLRESQPDLVYLNSLFDYRFSVLPLLVTRVLSRETPVVLAPRGELASGALSLKRTKKRIFIAAFRLLGMHKTVTWHASTDQEKADIERTFGPATRSHVAIDLRNGISCDSVDRNGACPPAGHSDGCSLIFFSRIVPMKNVATVIKAMALLPENVRLSIAGPIGDAKYWARCLSLIDDLGNQESVSYVGTVPADSAVRFLSRFDLFVLPTLGENFGHAVLESLAAGTPVIVGQDTPWHQVEAAGAGWMCDPASPEEVASLIQRHMALDGDARLGMRSAARDVAAKILTSSESVAANLSMFRALTTDARPIGPGQTPGRQGRARPR